MIPLSLTWTKRTIGHHYHYEATFHTLTIDAATSGTGSDRSGFWQVWLDPNARLASGHTTGLVTAKRAAERWVEAYNLLAR